LKKEISILQEQIEILNIKFVEDVE